LDWVVPDVEQAKAAAEDIQEFDTALFGRRTYEIFEKFWAHVVVDDDMMITSASMASDEAYSRKSVCRSKSNFQKSLLSSRPSAS
jgi:dihydrofolate reductase